MEEDEHQEDGPEGSDEEPQAEEHVEPEKPSIPQYDDQTQALIDQASTSRRLYNEAADAVSELSSSIRKLEEKLNRDHGPEDEFVALDGQCFEFDHSEYTYTLCMFARTTQRSKSGGSDVNLGTWQDWKDVEGANYATMKYTGGLTCWNGPARSTIVNLSCGTENKIVSVTEPNKCEYSFDFVTPAVCYGSAETVHTHEEL